MSDYLRKLVASHMAQMDKVCAVCGHAYKWHRAGPPEFKDQCPRNAGRMDWDEEHPTFFKEKTDGGQ